MYFQNICGRECLLDKSDLDGTGWVNEGIMKIFYCFTSWSLTSIKWMEYLLIQPSAERAKTLKAVIGSSKSLYKHDI